MILSHKTRVSLAASLATGLLLAILFATVYFFARQSALNQTESELIGAMNALTGDSKELEINEFDESHPEMSFAVFQPNGNLALQHGRIRFKPVVGFQFVNDILEYGIVRKSQTVVVGTNWREISHGFKRLRLVFALLWAPLTFIVGLITWLTARSVFKPLARLTEQASAISGSKLTDRLIISDRAEFGELAQDLNRMLDRIEETVQREDQFASDAAHELRPPLAILRTRIETTLLRSRTSEEYVASHEFLLIELERLTRIVEALLRSTRAPVPVADPIDLEPCVLQAIARWQDSFVKSGVFLQVGHESCLVAMTPEEIAIVVDNLLDNALRFSNDGDTVKVKLHQDGTTGILSVCDEGPGIPSELGAKIFERFVRSGDDRNRSSGGAGIGLSVCHKVLSSRGGSIAIRDHSPKGACLECRIPLCTNQTTPI